MGGDVFLELADGAAQPQVLAGLRRFGAISRISETAWEFAWMPVVSSSSRDAAAPQIGPSSSIVRLASARSFRWSIDALDLEVGSLLANISNVLRVGSICEHLVASGSVARFLCFPPGNANDPFDAESVEHALIRSAEPGDRSDASTVVLGGAAFNAKEVARRVVGVSAPGEREMFARLAGYLNVVGRHREERAQEVADIAASFDQSGEDINARLARAVEALRNRSRGVI